MIYLDERILSSNFFKNIFLLYCIEMIYVFMFSESNIILCDFEFICINFNV